MKKNFLFLLLLLLTIIVGGFLWLIPKVVKKEEKTIAYLAKPQLTDFSVIETKEGKLVWQLEAQDAYLFTEKENMAKLTKINWQLFPKDFLNLSAQSGILYIDSKDFNLQGDINIKFKDIRIKTKTLNFDNTCYLISTKEKVFIQRNDNMQLIGENMVISPYKEIISLNNCKCTYLYKFSISSDKLYFDRKKGKLIFEGNVVLEREIKNKRTKVELGYLEVLGKADKIEFIEGMGNPIEFIDEESKININCKKIKYFVKEDYYEGEEEVKINHLDTLAFCDKFFYYIKEKKLKLLGNPYVLYKKDNMISGKEIVIYPEMERIEIKGKVRGTFSITSK
jgi:LPS export ABC transporter protein LptC